ncbi:lytic polysaccharide monooxygenase [Streptomyces sp. NPDC020965]|uniref:lytic polysaccharide monooxygenase auxiliary activity family 9 protein n=1 Tax=Streptomyces sp. NPDC020965 TaxID=3365105 RepID=UPI003793146A
MTARRMAATVAALGVAPLALTALTAAPAAAHGSMADPVSRVSACFAEGPESPDSAACKALVAAGGTQPLYDWNEVNLADVNGAHKQRIPDGKLCSVGRDKYKGLDAPRTDWPSSQLSPGSHTFRWRATAPHRGTLSLYITKDGYDPTKPLKWSDLEAQPFVSMVDPPLVNGSYVFPGTVPNKSGRHLVYSILQRSDSPEAFYTCSDVVFGKESGGVTTPAAKAPSDQEIKQGATKSTVDHNGHGGDSPGEVKKNATHVAHQAGTKSTGNTPVTNAVVVASNTETASLAETGGDNTTPYIAIGGAAALALGAAAMFGTARRRALGGRSAR